MEALGTKRVPKGGREGVEELARTLVATAPSMKFTPSAVAALMGMASPASVRDNTVVPMRRLGLIDDDGALTPRGNKWRVDASYPEVGREEVLDEIYPEELLSLTGPDGLPDGARVKTGSTHRGFGDSNARQMAATFTMIASKQLPEGTSTEPKRAVPKKSGDREGRPVGGVPLR